jgi:ATP-dependent protease ClpP protease subunit
MSLKRKRFDVLLTKAKEKKTESTITDVLAGLASEDAKKDSAITREGNHIYFYDEVDRDTIFELCQLIKEAEEENIITAFKMQIDPIPIYLHISSYGGSIFAAFGAVDVITACTVPIHTIIEGATASAGTLISIFGTKRYIRPRAYMLIHQLSSECWGKMREIEDEYINLKELTEKITGMYRERTHLTKKQLADLLLHDLWLNAEKCIQYGLVDELYTKRF